METGMAEDQDIDPSQLAREIEAAADEFTRLSALATRIGMEVKAELLDLHTMGSDAPSPVLSVRVVRKV